MGLLSSPIGSSTAAGASEASPTQAQSDGLALLKGTGGAICPITALTSTSNAGAFLGVGAEGTSSVTEAQTTDADHPLEVSMSQGLDAGLKLQYGISNPPIAGTAMADALLGYTTSSIYDVKTVAEGNSLVAFAEDPAKANPTLLRLLFASKQQTFAAGDASIGGSVSAFDLGESAGLGIQIGVAHDASGDSELISTFSGNADADAALGLQGLSTSIDISLIQDVVLGPNSAVIGVKDTLDFDDNGSFGFEKSLGGDDDSEGGASEGSTGGGSAEGSESKATDGAMGDGAAEFGLTAGSSGSGDAGELVGALPMAGLASNQQAEALHDLEGEAVGAAEGNLAGVISSAYDITTLMGSNGLVAYRRNHIDTDSSGVDLSAGVGLQFSLDFGSTDESTTLVDSYQIASDGTVSSFGPCSSTIILPTVKKGSLPGIGATMQHWSAFHPADLSSAQPVANPPCAVSAGPRCVGGFPGTYGPLTLYGDEFQLVEPASGSDCPIPYVAEARLAEEKACRVGGIVVVLPHPVDEQAAVALAKSQLPPGNRVTQAPPPTDQIIGDVQCQTWSNHTLAGLPSLADDGGAVQVSFISGITGMSAIGSGLSALLGLLPSGPATYDPNDIYAIGVSADGGQESLC
jgi:hypothetical protein